MLNIFEKRNALLVVLTLSCGTALYSHYKANSVHETVIHKKSTFYTPGQHGNCKWVVHISDRITTATGDNSPVQIGIPEIIKGGYIAGTLQNGPGQSLLLAFKLPTKNEKIPPLIFTASYTLKELPLKTIAFRVFNSTILRMVLYSSEEKCVEATMK